MICIEARLDYDATTSTKPDLDCPGLLPIHHIEQWLGRPDLHFDELRLFRFSQSFLPRKKL